jgi:hypothetical protein
MPARRHFGNVRQRSSGRWQVRYRGPDGRMRSAPETFARKAEAQRYLTLIEAQIARSDWIDPTRSKITAGDYADRWIAERRGCVRGPSSDGGAARTNASARWTRDRGCSESGAGSMAPGARCSSTRRDVAVPRSSGMIPECTGQGGSGMACFARPSGATVVACSPADITGITLTRGGMPGRHELRDLDHRSRGSGPQR